MIDPLFIELNSGLLYTCVAIFSLIVGSLLNVVIYRLPLMMEATIKSECRALLDRVEEPDSTVNLFFPRSFCPSCKSKLKAWHNIPVLSYLFLRGRCGNCQQSISLRYPMIELLTCLLSVFASWHFGFNGHLVFALLFIWLLIPMIFIDIDHQLLPDSLTLSLLWIGLIANTYNLFTPLSTAVLSAAGAYLSLWLFIELFYLVTGKIGMGNGDFKLFAAFGAWFGWTLLPMILLFSSIVGAVIGVIYLKLQQKSNDTPMPFGPYLCVAGLISLFYGQQIMGWYLGRFL